MRTEMDDERNSTLLLLRRTRRMTRAALEPLEPGAAAHDGEQTWQVRDMLGHLGVWNGEAARSLEAHAAGSAYTCIEGTGLYDAYNDQAAVERRAWPMADVWAEYESTHDRLEAAIGTMPPDRWDTPIQYPWTELGSVVGLVVLMTEHETSDHVEPMLVRSGGS